MASEAATFTSTLLVQNIHCPSCVSYAEDVLQGLSGIIRIDISIVHHIIRVQHVGDLSREIVQRLLRAAFEVEHVTVNEASGRQIRDDAIKHDSVSPPISFLGWPVFMSRTQKRHLENCNACQEERTRKSVTRHTWKSISKKRKLARSPSETSYMERGEHLVNRQSTHTRSTSDVTAGRGDDLDVDDVYSTTVLIQGMTCASCVSTVTKAVEQIPGVESISVNLMANSAQVMFRQPKCTTKDISQTIEDVGFEAEVGNVQPSKLQSKSACNLKATLSIEGMTCGSCVGTVTRGLQELNFVRSVNVDLVSNSAVVVLDDGDNVNSIITKIEDLGYDAALISIKESEAQAPTSKSEERTVKIQIDGMYCSKCPQRFVQALTDKFSLGVSIIHEPTMRSPYIVLAYKPSIPALTIRTIIAFANSIDPACSASVFHPPTLEQRSRSIQYKERNRILRHLFLTFLVAIPTFIIGVVYMNLVSRGNPVRQWFEEPIWAGTAMRSDWAMFIMTTPVMFYAASLFHTRALKEIWSLWRPQSKVPILRRFYRFGSMNLLISAGTTVAYFASLAILILDATSTPGMSNDNRTQTRGSVTYFDTVTFLTFFILIGRFLEAYSKAKTGDAVSMLSKLRPKDALLMESISNGDGPDKHGITRVSVDLLEVGDIVSVPHGTCPPTDGLVDQEDSVLFDESSLTGESKPVRKSKGDKVYTGSVNVSDPVRVSVTEIGGKSMLDQIVSVVREGQSKRAPIERLADILTGYFTPIITLLAITTWVIWLALGESGTLPRSWLDVDRGGWAFWSVEFAIAVFVVACPCGIGLAAPTALFVGGGLAARSGILVQGGGEAFQEASRLDAIVFDKTGTLTEGKMVVVDTEIFDNEDGIDQKLIFFSLAKALEESSSHPIAGAIVKYCEFRLQDGETPYVQAVQVREVSGKGMTGTFNIKTSTGETETYEAMIGNETLLHAFAVDTEQEKEMSEKQKAKTGTQPSSLPSFVSATLSRYQSSGCSTAILSVRRMIKNAKASSRASLFNPSAIFAISDPIRPEAYGIISDLRSRGIAVHMCTGDNSKTALAIASQLEIPVTHIRAGALPQDKAQYIGELQNPSPHDQSHLQTTKRRQIVAFVGDGTNDTPALTVSDVSIAVSHTSSSDIALTSSSFILLNSSLTSILELVTLSRRVFQRVKLNFAWAGIYNIILIPVAAGVFFAVGANEAHGGWRLSPVWAAAAMAGSSVSVVLSSLALRLPGIRFDRLLGKGSERSG